jgi:hypothetical protein
MIDPSEAMWPEFIGTLIVQIRAALAVGLPNDHALHSNDSGSVHEGQTGFMQDPPRVSDWTGQYLDDSPGYLTRNGLGSLEIGAYTNRTDN